VAQEGKKILQIYPRLSPSFSVALTRVEKQEGDRYLVMDGLSESTIPLSIHDERATVLRELLRQHSHPGAREDAQFVDQILANRKERDEGIAQYLRRFRYRDICPKRALLRLVSDGIYSLDDSLLQVAARWLSPEQIETVKMTIPQRIAHLEALVERLRTHRHYELILLEDEEAAICRTYYLAKARYAVLLEYWRPRPDGTKEQVDIEINEPAIVRAFYDNPLWAHYAALPAGHKERVIAFLEEQLEVLRRGGPIAPAEPTPAAFERASL
jgi:hypothetical protein